jgi:hypothetical protein
MWRAAQKNALCTKKYTHGDTVNGIEITRKEVKTPEQVLKEYGVYREVLHEIGDIVMDGPWFGNPQGLIDQVRSLKDRVFRAEAANDALLNLKQISDQRTSKYVQHIQNIAAAVVGECRRAAAEPVRQALGEAVKLGDCQN